MARYSGRIGFAHVARTSPGVSSEIITERGPYYGEIKRETRTLVANDNLNDNLGTSNTIEVIADAYASENIFAIRFVEWAGTPWKVAEVTVQRPRLLLRLGGVYNGRRADPTPDPAPDAP